MGVTLRYITLRYITLRFAVRIFGIGDFEMANRYFNLQARCKNTKVKKSQKIDDEILF